MHTGKRHQTAKDDEGQDSYQEAGSTSAASTSNTDGNELDIQNKDSDSLNQKETDVNHCEMVHVDLDTIMVVSSARSMDLGEPPRTPIFEVSLGAKAADSANTHGTCS